MGAYETEATLVYLNYVADLFFFTLETMCSMRMSELEIYTCRDRGIQSARMMAQMILERLPPEHHEPMLQAIQQRFVTTLFAHDEPWAWDVFKSFSAVLPETALN